MYVIKHNVDELPDFNSLELNKDCMKSIWDILVTPHAKNLSVEDLDEISWVGLALRDIAKKAYAFEMLTSEENQYSKN
jgi:hypothetical protein